MSISDCQVEMHGHKGWQSGGVHMKDYRFSPSAIKKSGPILTIVYI